MCSVKKLLALALVFTSLAACGDLKSDPDSTESVGERHEDFGDFGYDNVYRYYGGPSAVSQKVSMTGQR